MNARRPDSAAPLTQARRVVVKVGSALLVDGDSGRVNRAWLETLVEDLLRLRRRGQRVILVSSGAIALGRRRLGLKHGALRLEESQAAAAVGQIRLAHAYKELFEGCDVTVAQVLLTLDDSENRPRYLNARATLEALLERSEEHTSELQSRLHLVCRLLLENKKSRFRRTSPATSRSPPRLLHSPIKAGGSVPARSWVRVQVTTHGTTSKR